MLSHLHFQRCYLLFLYKHQSEWLFAGVVWASSWLPLKSSSVSVVFVFSASLIDVAPASLMPFPVFWDESELFIVSDAPFALTSKIKPFERSVRFQHFAHCLCTCASNRVAFSKQTWIRWEFWYLFFNLLLQHRLRVASYLFVFSASLSDVAPMSPNLFPVGYKKICCWCVCPP